MLDNETMKEMEGVVSATHVDAVQAPAQVQDPAPSPAPSRNTTLGEQRVRTDFNAAQGSPRLSVADIKAKTAELINICDDLKGADPRAADIAQMRFEEAAMWAVKAATA